jgi:hypothetical protein
MPIGEQLCRNLLAVSVPNEDIAALLYQSIPRVYLMDHQATALPPALALGVIRNDGVNAATLQARCATDPQVIERLVTDARIAIKEIMAARTDLAPFDYQRLWTFAINHHRSEMLESLAPSIDLAWALAQNLAGDNVTRQTWDVIAQRVIDSGEPALQAAALAQARTELVAQTLTLVAGRDLAEFKALMATVEFNEAVILSAIRADYCHNSDVARELTAHLAPDFKNTRDFKVIVQGWGQSVHAADLSAVIMDQVRDATLSVSDIVTYLGRTRVPWVAIAEYIAEALGPDPRAWAQLTHLADACPGNSLPELLAEILGNA